MNNTFSIKRIGLLYRQYYFLNDKKLFLTLGATVGLIVAIHTFTHIVKLGHLNTVNPQYFMIVFLFCFIGGTLLWTGYAFPGFRTKEKCFNYLTVPASTSEKFVFELINRLILFIVVFPAIYWCFTNLVTWSFHQYVPEYVNYKFSYSFPKPSLSVREIVLIVSLCFLIFTISFAGASYFKTLPIVKTIVVVFVLVCVYALYVYLVVEKLGLKQYNPANDRILFMRSADDAKLAGIFAAITANLFLLAISFFRLKEKEV
jgi:hypothetical protein